MKLRRLLAMLLSLCLLLALAAVPALADGQEEPAGREELPLPGALQNKSFCDAPTSKRQNIQEQEKCA